MLVVPVLLALVATSCGGDDDDADADESTEVSEVEAGVTEEETAPEATDEEEPAATTAPVDEDTSDGSPVIETLPPATVPDPVVGGTLRYGIESDTDGINPTQSALSAPGLMMTNAVFDTLAAVTPEGDVVPNLAESFTPSEDFKSWTMKLRPDILFHDGQPLNADAIIVNFEAQRNHPLVGLAVKPFFPETDAVVKIDDLTVQFNLLDPNAYFPATLVGQLGMPGSPQWLAAAAEDGTLNQQPVGTGPFKFDSRSQDSVTRFVRNDDWWGGEVYLDAVEFYPVPDSATRTDRLLAGELDAVQTTDPESILVLEDEGIAGNIDDSAAEQFAMINSEQPPFDDIRARQALAYATPRQNYLDLIALGVIRGADQRFIPEDPYHNPDVKQVGDEPDTAVALAAEYCAERGAETNPVTGQPTCTDGKINIELQWSGPSVHQTRRREILTEGWNAAFNVTPDELAEDEHIQQTALGQYNVNLWRQFEAEDPSADNVWLLCRTIGGISLNWPRLCDPDRDAALLAAQATTDKAERISLYQQVEQMLNEDFVYIFLTHTAWANSFADNVHGVCDRTSPEGVKLKCAVAGRTWFSTVWMD